MQVKERDLKGNKGGGATRVFIGMTRNCGDFEVKGKQTRDITRGEMKRERGGVSISGLLENALVMTMS